jgi:Tol biopolymer transport system component/imidazolonepropionase-like amidohydrolase
MINIKQTTAFITIVLMLVTPGLLSGQMQGPVAGVGTAAEDLPLKPGRKIEFDTDEGTWLSLDVSPDGQTIVFEMLGDIYTLPIGGGTAKLLFGGMAYESQPRFSPDGRMLTFLSDREGSENVWVANVDGTNPRRISSESQMIYCSPSFSSDGKQVFASRGTGKLPFELWAYDVDGSSSGKKIVIGKRSEGPPAQGSNALGVFPSKDGRYLYYSSRTGRLGAVNLQFPLWQVARLDRQTGREELLTQEQGSAFSPVLSPDGTKLVYGTRYETETGLRIKDLKTDDDRWLKYPIQRDDEETFFHPSSDIIPRYAFTPDGSALLTSYGGKINRIEIANGRSSVVPFKVHVSMDIGPLLDYPERLDDGPVRARIIQTPRPSPDGKRLAFSTFAHVYVMDLPDGKPRQLTNTAGGEFQPVWSPDGQWIAFVTWTDQGGDIWKIRSDGSGAAQRLTRASAFYKDLAWSPDGSKLVALKVETKVQLKDQRNVAVNEAASDQDLVWLPADGGETKVVMPAGGLMRPQFTSQSDRIYYQLGQDLMSVRFDGTDLKKHFKVTGRGAGDRDIGPASELRVSPDGHWAIVVFHMVHSQAYLVPISEGAPASVDVTAENTSAKVFGLTGVDYLEWTNAGKTITWAAGRTFFQQSLDAVQNQSGPDSIQVSEVIVERERKKPTGTIVLRGARAITMRGDEVIPDSDIVVTENRIVSIGARGTLSLPAEAKIIDVKGKTIVPGFIDMHDHWLDIQREVLDLKNWNLMMTLAFGVTTGRDPQIDTNDTFVYGDLVEAGDIPGPRVFASGGGIFWSYNLKNVEQAERVLARYKNLYHIKFVKQYLIGNRRQKQLLAMACQKLGLMPTAEGQGDTKVGLIHVIDGLSGNEHVMPTVPMYRDMVELIARSKVFYTPTLVITGGGLYAENYFYTNTEVAHDPKVQRFMPHNLIEAKMKRRQWFAKDEYNFPRVAASLAKIVRAGGNVCVGSHGQLQGLAFHWEMWSMGAGMTPMEVLRSATLTGAQGLGYGADLGSLETGKLADLVILDKNPLDDIRNTTSIRYVMKNGQLYDGDTLNEIWPNQKPLAPLWWWNDRPNASITSTVSSGSLR